MKKRLMGLLLGVAFLFGAFASRAWGESRPGEVLLVLKNLTGAQLNAASIATDARSGALSAVAQSVGARVLHTYDALSQAGDAIFALVKSDVRTTEQLMTDLSKRAEVVAVSPNYVVRAMKVPNDPGYGELWGMRAIRAHEAWDATTGDDAVYVAVIDTGIDATHEDLKTNVDTALSRNFSNGDNAEPANDDRFQDVDGHGTHVAGTVGAAGDNGRGVVGVNWKVKIIALKVLGDDGSGKTAWVIGAINYLTDLAKRRPDLRIAAANLSLGGYASYSPEKMKATTEWLAYKVLDDLNRTAIVVAAGNEGLEVGVPAPFDDPRKYPSGEPANRFKKGWYCYPASFVGLNNLIVVGASDREDAAAEFSNWSATKVDVAAPGVDILSTIPKGGYDLMDGTSMAAPHVAGAAALLAARYPGKTASELKAALLRGANSEKNPVPVPFPKFPDYQGVNPSGQKLSAHGLLDVKAAMDVLEKPVEKKYKIVVTATGNGAVAPSGTVEVPEGATQAFTFTPQAGHKVQEVVVDGASQGELLDYTFRDVTADHTLSVAFAPWTSPIPDPSAPGPIPVRPSKWTSEVTRTEGQGVVSLMLKTEFDTPRKLRNLRVTLRGVIEGSVKVQLFREGKQVATGAAYALKYEDFLHYALRISCNTTTPSKAAITDIRYQLEGSEAEYVNPLPEGGIPLNEMTAKAPSPSSNPQPAPNDPFTPSSGGGGGGCDGGFPFLTSLAALALFCRKR